MSEFSEARATIKTVAEALNYVESAYLDPEEEAPRSSYEKSFCVLSEGISSQDDKPAHLSDMMILDVKVQVFDRCNSPEQYEASQTDLEALAKALSLKFSEVSVETEDPQGDFFVSTITFKSRRA